MFLSVGKGGKSVQEISAVHHVSAKTECWTESGTCGNRKCVTNNRQIANKNIAKEHVSDSFCETCKSAVYVALVVTVLLQQHTVREQLLQGSGKLTTSVLGMHTNCFYGGPLCLRYTKICWKGLLYSQVSDCRGSSGLEILI